MLLKLIKTKGKKWAEIAKLIEGRTENAVKNRYNALMKKDVGTAEEIEDESFGQGTKEETKEDDNNQLDSNMVLDVDDNNNSNSSNRNANNSNNNNINYDEEEDLDDDDDDDLEESSSNEDEESNEPNESCGVSGAHSFGNQPQGEPIPQAESDRINVLIQQISQTKISDEQLQENQLTQS